MSECCILHTTSIRSSDNAAGYMLSPAYPYNHKTYEMRNTVRKASRIITLLLAALTGIVLGGCGRKNETVQTDEINVIFIPKVTGNAFFESANKGAQAFAELIGFQVTYTGSPEAEIANQAVIIEQAIEEKADAICISSLDATALDEVLKRAGDAGIAVVTWDSDVSEDARAVMVSQGTPGQLGHMLVEMGAKSLTSRGKNPSKDAVNYVWHYSQSAVADQNSWYAAGEAYIRSNYPQWVNVAQENYYSYQNYDMAVETGSRILTEHPDIDLIICNDSTALPGQAQAVLNAGLTAGDITVTGFASPNAMRDYCKANIVERWGLWDCQLQGALGCYFAYYLADGNKIQVGDIVDVPGIGLLELMPNTVLNQAADTTSGSGVILLPQRLEFTISNVDDYDF